MKDLRRQPASEAPQRSSRAESHSHPRARGPEGGDGATRTQGSPRETGTTVKGVCPLHPPPSLSPHWPNLVEQELTQESGKHSLQGPIHLRCTRGEGWGADLRANKLRIYEPLWASRQSEAFKMNWSEMWTDSPVESLTNNSFMILMKHTNIC